MVDHTYLEQLQSKVSDLETRMSSPEVSSDPKKMQECMRDYSHQKKLLECAGKVVAMQDSKTESEAILADADSDDELREMAEMERAEIEESLPVAERELMVALIPPDPTDSRNVIMEIRSVPKLTGSCSENRIAPTTPNMNMRTQRRRKM